MKKMILGLALCFGLSNIAVAADNGSVKLTDKETKGAIAWIKNNPKKFSALVASAATLLYAGYNIYYAEADKDAKWARTTKAKNGLYNSFVSPFVTAGSWTKNKAVAGKDAVVNNMKEHKKLWIGVPSAVAIVAAIVVAADYATTDKEAQMRITQLWNKLFGKEVVA